MHIHPLPSRLQRWLVAGICLSTGLAFAADEKTAWQFSFAPGKPVPSCIQVAPDTTYSAERGYGFEPGATITAVNRGGEDPLRAGFCTSDKPFYFSVKLPEGNYHVTVTLGDPKGESTTTVKAELRRLMLERVHTASGQIVSREFDVNVRTPQITGDSQVRLKDREKTMEAWAWDDKLTLEFNDSRPCVCALTITPADNDITVYLLGDSTVCDQPREPWNSWGQMLPRFFGPGVVVANHAESGEALRSSLGAKRVEKILSTLKTNDYFFLQFGHNDMKEKGAGVGAFTTYETDLKRVIADIRQRGGIPVLVTSMERKAGVDQPTLGDYPEAVRRAARDEHVALIDLNAMSKVFYKALGTNLDKAFVDGTHHNNYGSYELARCVVEGIKAAKLDLARYLASDVGAFDPAHPDPVESFRIPASPMRDPAKPEGN